MAKIFAEVIETPGAEKPFSVVVSFENGTSIGEPVPVGSYDEGEALIITTLKGLQDLAKKEGHL